jgi:hypothetical protein
MNLRIKLDAPRLNLPKPPPAPRPTSLSQAMATMTVKWESETAVVEKLVLQAFEEVLAYHAGLWQNKRGEAAIGLALPRVARVLAAYHGRSGPQAALDL